MLSSEPSIYQYESKNGEVWRISKISDEKQLPDSLCVPLDSIKNISAYVDATGRLKWNAPQGKWIILRMGATSTGYTNATGGGGKGLECDKFDTTVAAFQFNNWFGETIKQVGPGLAKKGLSIFSNYIPSIDKNNEYFVELHFQLAEDKPWAYKGFNMADVQFQLNEAKHVVSKPSASKIELATSDSAYTINGKDFSIQFNKNNGALSSYLTDGVQQIFQPLLPHFTRPLTDNDKRGWKPQQLLHQWYEAKPVLKNMQVEQTSNGLLKITSLYTVIKDSAEVKIVYTITGNGVVKVDYALRANNNLPDNPEVGAQCAINKNDSLIQWHGRGLYENYIDKNYGFDVGVYQLPLSQFDEPYVAPQENGNRTDVRWMFLHSASTKKGLLIVGR